MCSRNSPWATSLAAVVLLAALAGCGSRLDHAELVAALQRDDARQARPPTGGIAVPEAGPSTVAAPSETNGTSPDGASGSASLSTNDGTSGSAGDDETSAVGPSDARGGAPSACTGAKSPILIGTVGEQSGIAGAAVGSGPRAVQAWVAMINDRGGIACHPVRYKIADDGGDPAKHSALVKQMIEDDRVLALVHMNAPIAGQASFDYIARHRTPVIGSETGEPWFYRSPMYFPQASSGDGPVDAQMNAAAFAAHRDGRNALAAIACLEAPVCAGLNGIAADDSAALGMNLVYNAKASIIQPDYTSHCQQAKNAGADIFAVGLDPASVARVARSCNSVGFHPQYALASAQYGASLRTDPLLDGVVVGLTTVPWIVTENRNVAEFRDALARYAPGLEAGADAMAGWVSAKLLERAAQHISDNPTSEEVLEGLWSITDDDLGGLTMPLTFTRDQITPYRLCFWLVQVNGGAETSPNGGARTCR